jgi:hypothetical protein
MDDVGSHAYVWSASEDASGDAYGLDYGDGTVGVLEWNSAGKIYGQPVRCVK